MRLWPRRRTCLDCGFLYSHERLTLERRSELRVLEEAARRRPEAAVDFHIAARGVQCHRGLWPSRNLDHPRELRASRHHCTGFHPVIAGLEAAQHYEHEQAAQRSRDSFRQRLFLVLLGAIVGALLASLRS